ncbi:MAG: protein kinase, partial [Myxococcales bacterium]|nr:protein kinase [Myxococcales bacterium]
VWSATQVALRRRVAVKRLRDERVGPQAEAQLLREALVTGALEHPNIVPVHALGRDDDGRPLLVMKRIEGTPWSERIEPLYADERPPDPRTVELHLGILMQVCQALDFAHAQGVIHRDIKPENVMVGSFGEVYLLDWGIAVSTRGGDTGLPALERGTLVGTPGYMAPEMAAADVDRIDQRTDVYLLGATLHELVTGQVRHAADGVFATLTLAFESAPYDYPEWVPMELAAICNRACHLDPEQRFPRASDLREALAEFLRHGSSRELAEVGWERLEVLGDMLGPDVHTVTADAIQIHALASEGRFAFERALQEWPRNEEASDGLQRLLELMIRYELANGNLRTAAGLVGSLPHRRPQLEQELERLGNAQQQRRQEIARLERLRFEADINVFSRPRRRLSYLHGLTLAVLVGGLTVLRSLGVHEPGYPDAVFVITVLAVVVAVGRRRAMAEHAANEANRRLFDSLLGTLVFMVGALVMGWWGGVAYHASLALSILLGSAAAAMNAIFFDRRLVWMTVSLALVAVAVMVSPEYRGVWIAVGGFVAFAASGIIWREVEKGEHRTQREAMLERRSTAGSGASHE